MFSRTVQEQIAQELAHAEAARAAGNEGRARVCARRAVGAAIRAALQARTGSLPASNAYELLQQMQSWPNLPAEMHAAAAHLTRRVDTQFELPAEMDLISDARQLIQYLDSISMEESK